MQHVTVFPSAARTATPTAVVLETRGAHGLHMFVDATAVTATPAVTPNIAGYDPTSGKFYTLLTGAAIATVSTVLLAVYPGIQVQANLAASAVLPEFVRIQMAHGDADSITYSVGVTLID